MFDLMKDPIITSILDTDLYKLTMMQAVFHQYPKCPVEYVFINRDRDNKLGYLRPFVEAQAGFMAELKLQPAERDFLEAQGLFTEDFLDFLSNYRFQPNHLQISTPNGDLGLLIPGLWDLEILWETPLLGIISESHTRTNPDFDPQVNYNIGRQRMQQKIQMINQNHLKMVEFGARRRATAEWQDEEVRLLKDGCEPGLLLGTSNVHLAMKYSLKPIGTVAHEWFMAHMRLVDDLRQAQPRALAVWRQEYGRQLNIALTDTFTSGAFFQDLNPELAEFLQGLRQDSGSPISYGHNAIYQYTRLGISIRDKSVLFSDSLDVPDCLPIQNEFRNFFNSIFCIGTMFSNDIGLKAPKIVIKLHECYGLPVVKLSDTTGKVLGDPAAIAEIKAVYNLS